MSALHTARKGPRLRDLWIAALVLALLGCSSGPRTAEVSGKVTYKGEPVPVGMITFEAADGSGRADTNSIVDGNYALSKAPVGKVKVLISGGSEPTAASVRHQVHHKVGRGQIEMAQEMGVKTGPPQEASKAKGKGFKLPLRYTKAESSGLTYDVQPGKQTKDFNLD